MKKSAFRAACLLCFFFCSLFSLGLYCQDFSSIYNDLSQLETLINDTLLNTEAQWKQLEDLRKNLDESGSIIAAYGNIMSAQENSLETLRKQLSEMSETYKARSSLSEKYEQSSKFWRTFTLAAIPVTALISGGIVWTVKSDSNREPLVRWFEACRGVVDFRRINSLFGQKIMQSGRVK